MTSATPPARHALDTAQETREKYREGFDVPCVYCRESIQAEAFALWSSTRRLMSATCPTCARRVT